MKNSFSYMQLMTNDLGGATSFYKQLFSWDLKRKHPNEAYIEAMLDENMGVGMMEDEQPPAWLPYVHVTDIKVSVKKAKELGANVIVDVTAIPDHGGWYAVILDPQGAAIGLYQGD